jgi:hypothetical protein
MATRAAIFAAVVIAATASVGGRLTATVAAALFYNKFDVVENVSGGRRMEGSLC